MRLLAFVLSAPLQSWGIDSKWDNRETASFPTKSAIVGLLGCCLGYPRGDERINQLDYELYMAVRADQSGRIMTDFHTVKGTAGIMMTAGGGKRSSDTIITPRQYLQDARFTVFLWGDDSKLEECYQAMRHPCWAVYLGRKSCVPSVPLIPQWIEAASPVEALKTVSAENARYCSAIMQTEIEMLPGEQLREDERMIERMDKVVRADRNEYRRRTIRAGAVSREDLHVFE